MVFIFRCRCPVIMDGELAMLAAGAQEQAGPYEDDPRGVTHDIGVMRSVGQQVSPRTGVQTGLHIPEDQVPIVITSHKPKSTSLKQCMTSSKSCFGYLNNRK